MTMTLEKREGLYYCPTDVFTVDCDPVHCNVPSIHWAVADTPPIQRHHKEYSPIAYNCLTESELWMLRLGSPEEDQLDLMPGNVTGIPPSFQYHPFQFFDWKEEALVAERTSDIRWRFYMDFGFMRASSLEYKRPNKGTERVIASWDGYSLYLLVVDEASQYIWVFLMKSKKPPLDIIDTFLDHCGHELGGLIYTDQGGKLARSFTLTDMLLRKHNYVIEPTGADSLSQNGAIEIYNAKLVVRTQTLLYGSGLPAKYWSSALVHSVYLHNRLVHNVTRKTPFEAYFGVKPDLSHLKLFGSQVCVKRSGSRCSKLDQHNFKGCSWAILQRIRI
jgi:hypothetical protein